MKLWTVDFQPIYPVGCCLIILAEDIEQATKIASETIIHTSIRSITEVRNDVPGVVLYMSGDY